MEFPILKRHARPPQRVKIGKDLNCAAYRRLVAGYVDRIRAKVDGDVQAVFKEPQVFVPRAVKGLNSGCNFDGFLYQAGSDLRQGGTGLEAGESYVYWTHLFVWRLRWVGEASPLRCAEADSGMVGITNRVPIMSGD